MDINTKLVDILTDCCIGRTFNLTLHDAENGGCDKDSEKLILHGRFNVGNITLGELTAKAISSAVISYQNKNRENTSLKNGQKVDIELNPPRQKMSKVDRASKDGEKMTNDERLETIARLQEMNGS